MDTWEYKVISKKIEGWINRSMPEDVVQELNELGAEGWELVNAAPVTAGSSYQTSAVVLFLKRKVS